MARELAIEHAIDESFRKSMRQKLAAGNAVLADAGMAQAAAAIPPV
jgi:hypothetical protein